jgi:hypothetical protein
MDKIEFGYNWNGKLTNKAFTTIRLHSRKYIVGSTFDIYLKGESKGTALLKKVKTLKIDQLNEYISYLDTGYGVTETKNILSRMYKDIDLNSALFDFCLLVYVSEKKG